MVGDGWSGMGSQKRGWRECGVGCLSDDHVEELIFRQMLEGELALASVTRISLAQHRVAICGQRRQCGLGLCWRRGVHPWGCGVAVCSLEGGVPRTGSESRVAHIQG